MSIVLTRVTWYSRLLAVIFFIFGLPILTFYLGSQYEETKLSLESYGVSTIAPQSTVTTLAPTKTNTQTNTQASPAVALSGIQGKTSATGSIIVKKGTTVITETMIPKNGSFVFFLDPGTYTLSSSNKTFNEATIIVKARMMASVTLSQ